MQSLPLRIGTRGSPLALAQAHEVRTRLMGAHGLPEDAIQVRVITTSGDRIQEQALSEFGGKGLFTKEIETALIEGEIDLAVHSMKDMQTVLPEGLCVPCVLPREDVRDAFVSPRAPSLAALPPGAVVGTASLRRQAQVKRLRPDLEVVTFRGSVQTRLRKLEKGAADATLLAMAGLNRLGLADRATVPIEVDDMLPAVAQGAIGVETRVDDEATLKVLAPINDPATAICVAAERAFLAALDGSCRTPIAGLARIDGETVRFAGQILTPDGREAHQTSRTSAHAEASAAGADAGSELLARAGPNFFSES